LSALIAGLNSLNRNDLTASRAWLARNFDIKLMTHYIVLVNTAGAWDDTSGNYYLYQRITDGKWVMLPHDPDAMWGEAGPCAKQQSNCSPYMGTVDNPIRPGEFNLLKDVFIRAYR
jgi:spore coat protein CotH